MSFLFQSFGIAQSDGEDPFRRPHRQSDLIIIPATNASWELISFARSSADNGSGH